jgi:hypothetical protein
MLAQKMATGNTSSHVLWKKHKQKTKKQQNKNKHNTKQQHKQTTNNNKQTIQHNTNKTKHKPDKPHKN